MVWSFLSRFMARIFCFWYMPLNLCPIYEAFYSFPDSVKDFKEFANAIEAVKDKGVVVAVASPDDVDTAHKECSNFFQIKKAL